MKDTKTQPATDAVIDKLRKMQPTAWVYEDMLGRKCVGFERPSHRRNSHEPLFSAATHAVVMGLLNRLDAAEKERDALRAKVEQMERQEPVVYQRLYRDGSGTEDITDLPDVFERQRPLYTLPGAQDVPIVPEKLKHVESGFKGMFLREAQAYKRGWNECRAAMLAAAPEAKQ